MSKLETLAECYEEICRRIEFAALLGLDLRLSVICHTCEENFRMIPQDALDHIEQHLREERKRARSVATPAA